MYRLIGGIVNVKLFFIYAFEVIWGVYKKRKKKEGSAFVTLLLKIQNDVKLINHLYGTSRMN